jgi:NTP pyrophosphatase (non-canonical NTP hydrolase)
MKLGSAIEVYTSRKQDIETLLTWLRQEVQEHARYTKQEGGPDFGDAGDLGRVRELLIETLCFLAQRDEADVKKALADAAAGRNAHGKE